MKLLIAIILFFTVVDSSKEDNIKDLKLTQPYRFNSEVDNNEDSHKKYRNEENDSSNWSAKDTYGYRKPNGEYRVIDYLNDEYNFNSKTNEPGVLSSNLDDMTIRNNHFEKNHNIEQEGVLEQKQEKLIEEATTTSIPKAISTTTTKLSIDSVKTNRESVKFKSSKDRKSLNEKLSVHQLISESMPSLQMSVIPVYFVNKKTKSLTSVPYLEMKSVSKMPLLPGLVDPLNVIAGNLISFDTSPSFKIRTGTHYLPETYENPNKGHYYQEDNSDWVPIKLSNNQNFGPVFKE